jgi:GT2 family glycosyltransferase
MIDIVIVNWNSGNFIKDCISSINNYSNGLIKQIIVIDNNSTDYSDISIKGMPNVNLIKLESNYGFAKACNIGSSYSKSKYILFLNPDTTVYSGVFERVFAFMEDKNNIRTGICGVQQINKNKDISRHSNTFPTIFSYVFMITGLSNVFPRLGHVMKYWDHKESRKVDHVIGSFYFIRSAVFEMANGFDERFFMYLEDLDLSYRVKELGWDSMYLSDVKIMHYAGGSSKRVKAKRLFYSMQSRLLYVEKYFGKKSYFLVLMLIFSFGFLIRLFQALIKISPNLLKETVSGFYQLGIWIMSKKKFK